MDTSVERAHTVARLLDINAINTDVGRAICANLILALVEERKKLRETVVTALGILSEMQLSSGEKCEMAYEYLFKAHIALGEKG